MEGNKVILQLFCVALITLSAIYCNERIILIDNALHIFYVINENELGIMAGRWPVSLVRAGIWVASYLGYSLTSLIWIYSLSHLLFKIGIALLVYRIVGLMPFLVVVITYAFTIQHTFFWCVSELIPATFISAILYGVMIKSDGMNKLHFFLLGLFTAVLALFSHPQAILILGFICVYLLTDTYSLKKTMLSALILFLFIVKSMLINNWYDSMKFEGLKHNFSKFGFNIWDTQTFDQSLSFIRYDFFYLSIIILSVYGFLIYKRKFSKFSILFFFHFITYFLFIISNPDKVQVYYFESSLYPIVFMTVLSFMHDLCPDIKTKTFSVLLSLALLIALIKIIYVAPIYKLRLIYIEQMVKNINDDKVILDQDQIDISILGLDWALPFETLIVSELNHLSPNKTIVTTDYRRDYKKELGKENVFLNGLGGSFKLKAAANYFDISNHQYLIDSNFVFKKGDLLKE